MSDHFVQVLLMTTYSKKVISRVDGNAASYMTVTSKLMTSAKEYFCKRFSNFQEDPVLHRIADLSNLRLWPREIRGIFHLQKISENFYWEFVWEKRVSFVTSPTRSQAPLCHFSESPVNIQKWRAMRPIRCCFCAKC